MVNTPDEARTIVSGFVDGMHACCEYNYDSDSDKKATIVFLREYLDARLIVHECVHAAICWVSSEEMPNAPEGATDEDMHEHFCESCSRTAEQLCGDAFDCLLPNTHEA